MCIDMNNKLTFQLILIEMTLFVVGKTICSADVAVAKSDISKCKITN